jgi:hypothetical protein
MISFDNKVIKQQMNRQIKYTLHNRGKKYSENNKPLYDMGDLIIDNYNQEELIVCGYHLDIFMNRLEYSYILFREEKGSMFKVDQQRAKVSYFKPDDNLLLVKQTDKCKLEKFQNKYYNNIYDKIKFI